MSLAGVKSLSYNISSYSIAQWVKYGKKACTKTRNNRNETTGTKPPEQPERPEQESEMTGTTETKIEHDRNNVVEHDRNDSET